MSIMAKTPSGYKKIGSAYLGERPVDKVFNANGDVVYALQRELTGVPPLLFKGKEQSELLNYRIYGDTVDGESVGDLVTSGQHAGEYVVPVTVEGKNLLQNTATSQTKNGVTFTVNNDGSVTCNGTATALITFKVNAILTLPVGEFILTGSPTGGSWYSSYYLYVQSDNISPQKYYNDIGNGTTINNTSADIVYSTRIVIESGYSINNQTFYPMIRKAGIEDGTYEPYHTPVTTRIYLPEPIKMVGDEAEYIDYAEQKQHRVRKNLFSSRIEQGSFDGITGVPNNSSTRVRSHEDDYIFLTPGVYKISAMGVEHFVIKAYDLPDVSAFNYNLSMLNWAPLPSTITINTSAYYKFGFCKTNNPIITPSDISNIMLNAGSDALPYEPYIENTDVDVTLPALPIIKGTNTMSIDTTVQPSRMDIKGRIKSLT